MFGCVDVPHVQYHTGHGAHRHKNIIKTRLQGVPELDGHKKKGEPLVKNQKRKTEINKIGFNSTAVSLMHIEPVLVTYWISRIRQIRVDEFKCFIKCFKDKRVNQCWF
jgi:hypothetical protein